MTLREIEFWLRAAQIECQRTVYRQISCLLVGMVMAWCALGVVVGTLNPLLLFNPDFQPSFAVRFWCLWGIAMLASSSARAVYVATMKTHELRLSLHPTMTHLNQSVAPDALFFESEKSQ
jgi:hypothetical protein